MKQFVSILSGLALAAASTAATAADLSVGGKNFTEQQIIASMTSQYLEALGYDVDNRAGMGSAVLRQAQENGQIDLYWEYTGTSLITYNDISERLDPEETYARVKELDAEVGLVWLEPSDANNTYGLAMREDDAEERGIVTISDLAAAINDGEALTLASNAEFYARDDGLRPLQEMYEFEFGRRNVSRMDTGLTYPALRDGEVDVSVVFATDGRIPAFDLRVLEDDLEYFPAYALTPVIREETLEAFPELEEQLNALSALLDDETMAELNARVDVERETIERVAEAFLEEHDLL
ncbi:osmoprotectant transport system substrate-binding protein [Franzmannia pantelleriensis]|uniref:Osmoprotectant transport system substrate-binding protein n=1 Tax=Franzmannia pantelleriensis TaxID=48727 RepID=A0A1G9V882_9GAMM|nr:glycine betaine ABC transporter substrate-binding protein [Halomonas pantelleriensis]SDM68303.1 osmoprotectant transport system substrate-binding protein [Halomonas pantelleriensis]